MAQCSANDLIAEACQSGFTCRSEPELLALLNQLLCNYSEASQAGSGYTVTFVNYGSNSPADGATNYVGSGLQDNSTYSLASILIPKAGTITRWFIKVVIVNPGSAETVQHFLRINDSTDVGQINLSYDTASLTSLNTTVNQSVAEGDSVAIKIVCPTWATDPSGILYYGYALIT